MTKEDQSDRRSTLRKEEGVINYVNTSGSLGRKGSGRRWQRENGVGIVGRMCEDLRYRQKQKHLLELAPENKRGGTSRTRQSQTTMGALPRGEEAVAFQHALSWSGGFRKSCCFFKHTKKRAIN